MRRSIPRLDRRVLSHVLPLRHIAIPTLPRIMVDSAVCVHPHRDRGVLRRLMDRLVMVMALIVGGGADWGAELSVITALYPRAVPRA